METEQKANILLVDDHPNNLLVLEAALESLGQNTVKAQSGREALKCLLNQDFAVILLDVKMPDIDGFELAALIRERERSRRTPIIFITGFSKDDIHVQKGYSLGAVDYMVKPIVPEILRAKVAVFVDLFKKTEEVRRQSLEQQRLTFLAEASTALAASLDYETTLANVARLAVPYLADYCIVDMVEDENSVRQVAVAHVNSSKEEMVRKLRRLYPLDVNQKSPLYGVLKVLKTGQSELIPEIDEDWREERAKDDGQLELMKQLDFKSSMVVPLLARGRTLGVISLVMAESERLYTESDLVLAEDLARRCALAVDNARLYREAQEALHAREEALTREQEARREAEVANKVKDEFLATVSHELRTPLTAMLGWLRLLRSGKLNDKDTSRAIETIERNAKVQTQLIEDLLDVSRIITGKIHLEAEQVELSQVIQTAVDAVRPAAEAKEIKLEVKIDFDNTMVLGDPARLQQVILNLLTNAVKFTPDRGHVEVRLERQGSLAQVTVKDTGKGIKPEFLPYVFDRFAQADSTITRAYGGLGLGLAIVKHLTEMQGGTVLASSDGEGCGATFAIQFPLIKSSSQSYVENRVEEGSIFRLSNTPALDGLSVLVVEDEADTREMLTMVLEQSGAKVKASASAAEALQVLQQSRPDILISDIAMPGQDGHALIKKLRELEIEQGKQRIPAVALTAQARLEDRTQALAAGFNFHVPKPVEPTELVSLVATMAKRV